MKSIRPWNDVLVPNTKENEMDVLPEWFRSCMNSNHETEFVDNEIGCATCNRFAIRVNGEWHEEKHWKVL